MFCFASIIEIDWFTSVRSYYSWLLFSPLPKFLAATPRSNSSKNSTGIFIWKCHFLNLSLSLSLSLSLWERENGNKIVWLSLHLWYVTLIPASYIVGLIMHKHIYIYNIHTVLSYCIFFFWESTASYIVELIMHKHIYNIHMAFFYCIKKITFYHQIKTLIDLFCRQRLIPRSLI